MHKSEQPLAGITVLDAATFIAGPSCAALLGEFGADVIKVEPPAGGDPLRRLGTRAGDDSSLLWLNEGRGKRSVTLNLKDERGADLFTRLAAQADVVIENFRPGTLERWGLGYEALRKDNKSLIMLRVSGFGQTGPYKDRPGFARIAHAVGGLTHLTGEAGGAPLTPGSTSLADYMSGLYGAIGILLALRHRDATGEGQVIDVALYESVFRALDEIAPAHALTGLVRGRQGAGTVNACPHGHFPTRDDKWVAIACTNDKMFARLAEVMAQPGLAQTYGTVARRLAAQDIVDGLVRDWCLMHDQADIVALCDAGQVPCGAVLAIDDILKDAHFKARGTLKDMDVPGIGPLPFPAPLPRMSATPGQLRALGPDLGADTADILSAMLGLSAQDLARLKSDGVI